MSKSFGTKQRRPMPRKMSEKEALRYIDSNPGWATLSTLGSDGHPHSIPIGYFRVENKLYMGCRDKTQKVINIERNPKISVSLESGQTMNDIRGLLLRGHGRIIRESAERLSISIMAAKSRGVEDKDLPKSSSPEGVYIELSDFKITSWDYSS